VREQASYSTNGRGRVNDGVGACTHPRHVCYVMCTMLHIVLQVDVTSYWCIVLKAFFKPTNILLHNQLYTFIPISMTVMQYSK